MIAKLLEKLSRIGRTSFLQIKKNSHTLLCTPTCELFGFSTLRNSRHLIEVLVGDLVNHNIILGCV